MRDPARKALYYLLALLAGAGLVWFGAAREQRIGEHWSAIVPIALGFAVVPFPFVFLIQALFAIRGRARLLAGERVIARWHVFPSEWEQFRTFDSRRGGGAAAPVNALRLRKAAPGEAIEVIVGQGGLLVDRYYHGLSPRGLPELREVRWIDGPPICLEFGFIYPRSRYGGPVPATLRIPVPAGARVSAQRVVDHFRPRLVRKSALALRNPSRTCRVCAVLAASAAAMAVIGAAWANALPDSADPVVPAALLIVGIALGAFACILAAAVRLLTGPRRG